MIKNLKKPKWNKFYPKTTWYIHLYSTWQSKAAKCQDLEAETKDC